MKNGLPRSNPGYQNFATFGRYIFVGTDEAGVFYSSDSGKSWSAINVGLTNSDIKSLAATPDAVFAGTEGGGIWKLMNLCP